MKVAGIDVSSFAVDIVFVEYDDDGSEKPLWNRYDLTGADAFDRTRKVGQVVPGRHSGYWDDVVAVGIEEPAGRNPGFSFRVQGAVLSQIPGDKVVEKWMPSQWRKRVGLPGNCPKQSVREWAWRYDPRFTGLTDWDGPPQDACDALAVAVATRSALERKAA